MFPRIGNWQSLVYLFPRSGSFTTLGQPLGRTQWICLIVSSTASMGSLTRSGIGSQFLSRRYHQLVVAQHPLNLYPTKSSLATGKCASSQNAPSAPFPALQLQDALFDEAIGCKLHLHETIQTICGPEASFFFAHAIACSARHPLKMVQRPGSPSFHRWLKNMSIILSLPATWHRLE